MVAALDDWACCQVKGDRLAWVLAVARHADPDAWRDRVRRPEVWSDAAALERQAGLAPEGLPAEFGAAVGLRLWQLSGNATPFLLAAQRRLPGDFWVNFTLALALRDKEQVREATGYHRAAVASRPGAALGRSALGFALWREGRMAEAREELAVARRLDPRDAIARSLLEATEQQREALGALAAAEVAMGEGLADGGRLEEAIEEARRGLEFLLDGDPRRHGPLRLLRHCERLLALEKRLPAILRGEGRASDAEERLELARLCWRQKRLYMASARLYAAAFASDPRAASAGRLWNAACPAALAGCGQGDDAAMLNAKERGHYRGQALAWLKASLALWAKEGNSEVVKAVVSTWQKVPDLAGVREPSALEKLPEGERREWQRFWAEVDGLLRRAEGKKQGP
jgi:tetratricopeptide (TPR) repeat protein